MIHVFIFITVRHSARDDAAMIITYYCTVRVRVQYVYSSVIIVGRAKMQLITTQAGGVTLAANRKREFSFAPPRLPPPHRDGFPIKNAERVFFIARFGFLPLLSHLRPA